jgi:hypothetical protein
MERNGNVRPVNDDLKAPVLFYFSSAQQFFIPPIYATNFQFQYFGDYRQTLRLFLLRISYFNSPEPNLASPLNKKTIETRKSSKITVKGQNLQNGTAIAKIGSNSLYNNVEQVA